jgi:ribosomal protein L14
MLFIGSNLKVVDNCGAKLATCLRLKKKVKHVSAGDVILIVLKKFRNRKKTTKGVIYVGLIIGIKY